MADDVRRDDAGNCYVCDKKFYSKVIVVSRSSDYADYEDSIRVNNESVLTGTPHNKAEALKDYKENLELLVQKVHPTIISGLNSLMAYLPNVRQRINRLWDKAGLNPADEVVVLAEDYLRLSLNPGNQKSIADEVIKKIVDKYYTQVERTFWKDIEIHPMCANPLNLEEITSLDVSKPRLWKADIDFSDYLNKKGLPKDKALGAKGIILNYRMGLKHP